MVGRGHDHDAFMTVEAVQQVQQAGDDVIGITGIVVSRPRTVPESIDLVDEQDAGRLFGGTGKGCTHALDDVRATRALSGPLRQ